MSKDIFLFLPHTHWEGAVFKTREEYLELGLPIILRALRLLRKHRHYRFVLDQACFVAPFLERYPEEADTLRQCVADGRLQIVGGMHVMPDVNMPGGESLVRQILYGKRFFAREFDVDITTGWQLDTFGHHAQIPQIMRLAGYQTFWSQRGVPADDIPSDFIWEGLDGSQIPFIWMPQNYAVTYNSPTTLAEFADFMKQRYESLTPNSAGHGRLGPAGADVCLPEDHVPELVGPFNEQSDAPFELRIGLPSDYEQLVEARNEADPLVVTGERNPIFQGTYSSRIELKQRTRRVEALLRHAEAAGAMLRAAGVEDSVESLESAWEPMLFNHAHDLMCGVMTDHVHDDVMFGYETAARRAGAALEARHRDWTSAIDTQGEGVALVVSNCLAFARTDVAFADVGFSDDGVHDVRLVGPDGNDVPVQLCGDDRGADGSLLRAKIAFIAEVPAMGHAVYRLLPAHQAPEPATEQTDTTLENALLRLVVDPASGAITELLDKRSGASLLREPGNVIVREEDHGDLWEPYRTLNASQFVVMDDQHPPPPAGTGVRSTDVAAESAQVENGPVFSQVSVTHPFGNEGEFHTRVRLYHDLPRIEVHTRIRNDETYVRCRALFPTAIDQGRGVHEIPFGVVERPEGIEYPAQSWFANQGESGGIALLNRGLPGSNIAGNVMMISLMRSADIAAYGMGGGYEGQASSSGFEIGKENSFDYALVAYDGDWRDAGVTRQGQGFQQPLVARTAESSAGSVASSWSLLGSEADNVYVASVKGSEEGDDLIVRLYEGHGQPVEGAHLRWNGSISAVHEVDLLERHVADVAHDSDGWRLDLRPFEIKTYRVQL